MAKTLYQAVHSKPNLIHAWKIVRSNGVRSQSTETLKQIEEFDLESDRHLNRFSRQLRENRFKFDPSEGIPIKKKSKSGIRPIVLSPVKNRIVQRSILDALQGHKPLKKYFLVETSFGGIKKKGDEIAGVPAALSRAYELMSNGGKYFIRSDIKEFFTKIPKETVVNIIASTTNDDKFIQLLKEAITVELSNMDRLGKKADAFPIFEIGVAQGSCLSPLLGNILLNEFDIEMNKGDIACLRYIDDFILFAPTLKAANAAFKRALRLLSKHNLTCYDPRIDTKKAEMGETSKGFSFLGCDIRPGIIRPNKESKKRLLVNIKSKIDESVNLMSDPVQLAKKRKSLVDTLINVSNITKGWGNQYSFCNDEKLLEDLDVEIDKKISFYLSKYSDQRSLLTTKDQIINRRRLLGVHLLTDSKKKPIIEK